MDINGDLSLNLIHTVIARVKCKTYNPTVNPITAINAEVAKGLRAPVETGTTVLTMTAVGGVAPIIYSFKEHATLGADNALFSIVDNKIVVGKNSLTDGKTYKVYVEATDSEEHTYDEGFDIPVAEAYPEITSVTAKVTEGIREGETNAAKGATVATMTTVGGTEPYTYSISGTDAAKFEVSGSTIKAKANLTAGSNSIVVTATDAHKKTKATNVTIPVAEASTDKG